MGRRTLPLPAGAFVPDRSRSAGLAGALLDVGTNGPIGGRPRARQAHGPAQRGPVCARRARSDAAGAAAMTSADVYAAGRLVGHVTRRPDATTFTYAEGYDGPALVPHLPVGTTTWPAGALPPLLSNLLPEGRRLETLRQQVKTSLDNEVALLLAIGNDLVGDLQFVPAGARRRAPRGQPGPGGGRRDRREGTAGHPLRPARHR